jgi:hypothetical protein
MVERLIAECREWFADDQMDLAQLEAHLRSSNGGSARPAHRNRNGRFMRLSGRDGRTEQRPGWVLSGPSVTPQPTAR